MAETYSLPALLKTFIVRPDKSNFTLVVVCSLDCFSAEHRLVTLSELFSFEDLELWFVPKKLYICMYTYIVGD
jgi:hypothetical protein